MSLDLSYYKRPLYVEVCIKIYSNTSLVTKIRFVEQVGVLNYLTSFNTYTIVKINLILNPEVTSRNL